MLSSRNPLVRFKRLFIPPNSPERFGGWWKDPQGWIYFRKYAKSILDLVQGPRVLDVGCGEGHLTVKIADLVRVKDVIGIDKHLQHLTHPHVEYRHCIVPDIAPVLQDEKFNTIVSTEFIEHIALVDFHMMCNILCRHLERYGRFVGCTPVRRNEQLNKFHLHEFTYDELVTALYNHFVDVMVWEQNELLFWECTL